MQQWIKKLFKIFNSSSKWISIVLPVTLLGLLFFAVTIPNVYSQTYDIEQYNRAKETIRSPITIENEVETDRKIRETVQAISDRYTTLDEITEDQVEYINEIFDAIDSFTRDPKLEKEDELSMEEKVLQLQEILSDDITNKVDNITFRQLLQVDEKERSKGKKLFVDAVKNTLSSGVRIENINSAKEEVKSTIKFSSLSKDLKTPLDNLVDFAVVENSFFDMEKTMKARNEAASGVNPVVIQSGDIIVREGQIITKEMYDDLKLVGLLNNEKNIYPGLGLAIFILLLCGVIGYELNRLHNRNELDHTKVLAILLITMMVVILMKIASLYTTQLQHLYLLVPIATGALLLKTLIFERFSLILAILFAVLGSILFNGQIPGSLNIHACIYLLFFQITGIVLLKNLEDRIQLIKAAFGMAIINVMIIIMFIFLSIDKFNLTELMIQIGLGIGAAILSVILAIGLLPFFETGLGILSDNKLLSLANPNQPLVKKILLEAPGTYHHSVMVANLSETACEAIGANGLLARVGAYYHDIGKTIKPHFFIENQIAIRNPHDFIEPKESADIIISHVTEGVRMLNEYKLPKEIVAIAASHHGTSLVQYFYQLECKSNPETKEEDFRYPGPKPQTKEAGVISICDSVEAAVRSLKEPSPAKIDEIVLSIMNNKLMDGQLDQTPLTFKELSIVRETICEALKGIFHSRIQYPDKEAT